MNVGSILNGDTPAENAGGKSEMADSSDSPKQSAASLHQRNSINNLLNDAPGDRDEHEHDEGDRDADRSHTSIDAESSDDSISEMVKSTEREINEAISKEDLPSTQKQDPDSGVSHRKQDMRSVPNPKQAKAETDSRQESLPSQPDQGSNQSRTAARKFIDSELEKINQLKGIKTKPKRYSTPPIWAQRYYPPNQGPKDAVYKSLGPANADAATSSAPVFDRQSMYSADLECLITGVIPPQSTVRTIAEWLYANFVEILLENRQYVELELKFGTIVGKASGARLNIGVSSECIYTATADTRFEMGVHEVGWGDLKEFLNELERKYVDEAKKNPSNPRRKFNTTESDTTDYFFHVSERNEQPQKIRISKDNQLVPPRYVGIQKKRLSDLYIHSPSCVYDLRLSLSLEMPVNEASVEPLMKKKPTLQRGKKRISYSHAPTVTRFDFTEVSMPKKTKNKFGKTVVESERSHELELEIDTYQIFRGFDKIRDGSDTIRFEELVEIFLNNARCLNNRVTKLASK